MDIERTPIYLNHAATSPVKPRRVLERIADWLENDRHSSVGRGGGELSAARVLLETRLAAADFFGAASPASIVFTSGATESLNMAINGLVREGCHVLASGLEHNAVARPLHLLQQAGRITLDFLPVAADGSFDPEVIRKAIRPQTRLLVMTQASNVTGGLLPTAQSFAIAREYGLLTILDTAQTAGHLETKLSPDIDALAFTAHKGLGGLAGSGGLVLGASASAQMKVWKAGGTGSRSDSLAMPDVLPDRLEAGTPNLLGIVALGAALEERTEVGLDTIRQHERTLTSRFVSGLQSLNVTVHGRYREEDWLPVVSMTAAGFDCGELAARLFTQAGIETRSGLHCAPLAHQALGTFPEGTLRFSFGLSTTTAEIDQALEALEKILRAGA